MILCTKVEFTSLHSSHKCHMVFFSVNKISLYCLWIVYRNEVIVHSTLTSKTTT